MLTKNQTVKKGGDAKVRHKPQNNDWTKEPKTRIGMTKELAPHIGIMTNEFASVEYIERTKSFARHFFLSYSGHIPLHKDLL